MTDHKRIGTTVIYTLGTGDVAEIIRSRQQAGQVHARGNDPRAGQSFPAIIVSDFGPSRDPEVIEAGVILFKMRLDEQYRRAHGELVEGVHGWPSEFTEMTPASFAKHLEERVVEYRKSMAESLLHAGANLQVFLDGIDTYWATSRSEFLPEKMGYWRDPEHGAKLSPLNGANDQPYEAAEWVPDPEGHFEYLS